MHVHYAKSRVRRSKMKANNEIYLGAFSMAVEHIVDVVGGTGLLLRKRLMLLLMLAHFLPANEVCRTQDDAELTVVAFVFFFFYSAIHHKMR